MLWLKINRCLERTIQHSVLLQSDNASNKNKDNIKNEVDSLVVCSVNKSAHIDIRFQDASGFLHVYMLLSNDNITLTIGDDMEADLHVYVGVSDSRQFEGLCIKGDSRDSKLGGRKAEDDTLDEGAEGRGTGVGGIDDARRGCTRRSGLKGSGRRSHEDSTAITERERERERDKVNSGEREQTCFPF